MRSSRMCFYLASSREFLCKDGTPNPLLFSLPLNKMSSDVYC
uniref:Uncharacterized protein n=1 Tax=Aegilops tauschii subsp. strangulata TaxID=200361 RepID=A0A453PJJ0_AEGTS